MKVVCCICGKVVKEGTEPASHTYCDECLPEFLEDQGFGMKDIEE